LTIAAIWLVVGVKYIASVSFGKDSLAMLLMLIEKNYPLDYVVFYDTGMEFDSIYHIRDEIKSKLKELNIEYVELHPQEPFWISMLIREVKYRKQEGYHYGFSWCGGACRWGTSGKLQAIDKFKKTIDDDVTDYVGIAADEPQRFEKAKHEGKVLPLVEWNMTEADCLRYCRSKGYAWQEGGVDLYDCLDRVSCWCCRNKNLKELKSIYRYLPKYWKRLKGLEYRLCEPMKGNGKSILELEQRFEDEIEAELTSA